MVGEVSVQVETETWKNGRGGVEKEECTGRKQTAVDIECERDGKSDVEEVGCRTKHSSKEAQAIVALVGPRSHAVDRKMCFYAGRGGRDHGCIARCWPVCRAPHVLRS